MKLSAIRLGLALLALPPCADAAAAQAAPRFQVQAPAEVGWRPVIVTRGLVEEQALRGALESGLPLRFRLRVELWRKGLFDQLVDSEEVRVALAYDRLDRDYLLDSESHSARFSSLAAAQAGLELALSSRLRPAGRGRYYYLASLQVETLSLSDLEELQRWLRGEAAPAVQGRSSPGRAISRGLRRALVRVIGLPTWNFEDRSETFELR